LEGGKYTWSNNQVHPTLEKLDRVLMSREWELLFPTVVGWLLPRELSNHNPIVVSTQTCNQSNKRDFRFEVSWMKHPDFLSMVSRIWSEYTRDRTALDKVLFKLKKVKISRKGWGFNLASSKKQRKNQIQRDIRELEIVEENETLSDDQIKNRIELKTELFHILDEELYWYKRSHETLLLKGDSNTEYFHRIANGKKRKQSIFSMKDGADTIFRTDNRIKHATDYYKKLFGPREGNNFGLEPSPWSPGESVTNQENEELSKPFHEDEIKEALYQMEKNKAVGPDGFPIEFYQHCWEVIKGDIIDMFHEFYAGSLDIKRLNYGIITLLPKVKDAGKIQQFRSICLLNCLYKWFTKCLTLRLQVVADRIIHKSQAAFLPGRNIMNNILALHEILHEAKGRRKEGIVLKVDFEKAYDKVHWGFLLQCLMMRGFCGKWCDWIKMVLFGGTVAVKINNKVGPYFQSKKGVS
jgi:hypothetical protein